MVFWTSAAGLKSMLPDCEAVTTTFPVPVKDRVVPTITPGPLVTTYVTGKLEVAVALRAIVFFFSAVVGG